MATEVKYMYTGGNSTDSAGEVRSYIEVDDSIDFNGLTQAIKDFVEANKHKYFFGGINYCDNCQIIHPRDKCPLCEEYNWYVEDSLHERIEVIKNNEKYRTRYLEQEISELQIKINNVVLKSREDQNRIVDLELTISNFKAQVDRLKEHKSKLIAYIKRLLVMPHRRHIIFDEEEY